MQYRYGSTKVKYTTWNPIFVTPKKMGGWQRSKGAASEMLGS
jgi:hypothetical protein